MKKILITLMLSLSCLAYSQDYNSSDIPAIVSESMEEAVTQGSLLTALEIWHREGHLLKFKGDANYERNVYVIDKFEKESFGTAVSYKCLYIASPIEEIKQIYMVLKYTNGAFFIKLNCQLVNGAWDIKQYQFNTDPSKILPASFYN